MAYSSQVDPVYTCQLKQRIAEKFAFFFRPPDDFFMYFDKYISDVLTVRETDRVKAVSKSDGDHAGAEKLLELLCVRRNWFSCILQVLRDPEVKLPHVADDFEMMKERLDNNREEEEKTLKEKNNELEEQLRLKDQRILELEAERGKAENADHVDVTQEEDRELTGNVVRELEKVERTIKEERKHYKAELEKKDQLISDLTTKNTRQHNEIQSLQQEKNALLDSMQKQVLINGGSTLHDAFCPSCSESVTLFNFYMTSWIHKDTPDFASKHGIPRCDVPAALRNVADFMTNRRWNFICQFFQQYDLSRGKNDVTTFLQDIQDAVNSWRDQDWSEDNIKLNLLCNVVYFFSICYAILTALERHQTTELASVILYIRDSVSGMLDSLVDELGGWVHISSLLKENNSFWMQAEMDGEMDGELWAASWAQLYAEIRNAKVVEALRAEIKRRALSTQTSSQ